MGSGRTFLEGISQRQSSDTFRQVHWQGTFDEYLDIVRAQPEVTRSAYQRLYDMLLSYGTYTIEGGKESLVRYKFFDDPKNEGRDAIFGLTKPLIDLVNVFKSAALKDGTGMCDLVGAVKVRRVFGDQLEQLFKKFGERHDGAFAKVHHALLDAVTLRAPAVLSDEEGWVVAPALVLSAQAVKKPNDATIERGD